MTSVSKRSLKKQERKSLKKGISTKRKRAIEHAIQFWKSHAQEIDQFKLDREEANAR